MPEEPGKPKGPIHDPFVIQQLLQLPKARSLFQAYLPAQAAARVRWQTLKVLHSRFVDAELHSHYPDLLFAAEWDNGQIVLFYLLLEHKSWVDRQTLLQLLRGMLAAWEAFLKERPAGPIVLPFIFPFVLYHGPGDWTVSTQFADLVGLPEDLKEELGRNVPRFEHLLVDLHRMPMEELKGTIELKLVLALLKGVSEGREQEWVEKVFNPAMRLLAQPDALGFVKELFTYLLRAGGGISASTFWELADKIPEQNTKKAIMTLAEKLFEEGQQEGWQKGQQEGWQKGQQEGWINGQRTAVLGVLETRFGVVSSEAKEKIALMQTEGQLAIALRRALVAGSIQEFLKALS